MRILLAHLAVSLLSLAVASPAAAIDPRYAPTPPVVLSPDLSEPWIMQLRPPAYREVIASPDIVARRDAPPIGLWRGQPVTVQAAPAPSPTRVAYAQPNEHQIAPEFLPTEVPYQGVHKAGTVIIDTNERFLYLVEGNGMARRYGVGVGRPGFQWAGEHSITRKAEWPDWTPPPEMLKRAPNLPHHMDGGPDNPLGARALYLGSTEYRIHGSNEPWTIGHAVSSGCIRMRNEDVTDLYSRVRVGTKVVVM